MIKFFRKIRQNLLSEGKAGTYFQYAIGEIVLVVIGILIALQINNWNNYKQDRISERDYLKRIATDLTTDTLNFSWTINALKDKQESLGALLALIKKGELETADSTAILREIISGTYLAIAHPGIANGTFEELKNTGGMKQVRNTLLRSAINTYYFKREHANDRIENKRKESGYSLTINRMIPGLTIEDGEIGFRSDLVSYDDILKMVKSPEFKAIAISEYNVTTFFLKLQEGGLANSKNLLALLKKELQE